MLKGAGAGGLRSRAVGLAALVAEGCLAGLGVARPSALLILGHMRSGSSLLLHLLLTHPEISAMGERNAVYACRADLARLVLATRLARRSPFQRLRYVADQVNHNALTPNDRLLLDPRLRVVFLLRQPEAAIASLLEMSRVYYEGSWSLQRALEYYVDRLARLRQMGDLLGERAPIGLLHYEQLTQRPTEVLEALRTFLGLQQGFSQSYRVQPFTRTRGDPGPHIMSGRILQNTRAARELNPPQLRVASAAYRECRDALARHALLG